MFTSDRITTIARWIVVLCPLLLIAGVMGNEIPASLVAVLFLVRSAVTRDWAWTRAIWVRLLLVLWAYMSVRSGFAEFWRESLALSIPWVRWPVFAAALVFWILPDEKTQQRLMVTIVAAAGFLAIDTLIQHVFGQDIFGRVPMHAEGYYNRLTGPFSKPRVGIITAWLLIPSLAILSTLPFSRKRKRALLLALAFPILGVSAIYLSGERIAFLMTLAGYVALVVLIPRIRLIGLAVGVMAALTIMYLNHLHPEIRKRQMESSQKQISGFFHSPYGQLLLSSLKMAEERPLTGVGARNFRMICKRPEYGPMDAHSLDFRCGNHAHNIYSEWLAENGLIGLSLFTAAVLHWAWRCWRLRWVILRDTVLVGLTVAVGLRLLPILSGASQFASWWAMPCWLMIGFLLARLAMLERKSP